MTRTKWSIRTYRTVFPLNNENTCVLLLIFTSEVLALGQVFELVAIVVAVVVAEIHSKQLVVSRDRYISETLRLNSNSAEFDDIVRY